MEPTARAGMRYGGELSEYPKPWKLQYGEAWSDRRPIKIHSHVWGIGGYSLGGNGHHHADINEEDNSIWVEDDGGGCWGRPWRWNEDKEFRQALKGRWDSNVDLVHKKDVVKWAISVLREWGVLGDKEYKITWDLDEDDPLANVILAEEMRKRALRAD